MWAQRFVAVSGLACAAEAAHPGFAGRAQVVRTGSGRTMLTVHLEGLEPGATYGLHVHDEDCADLG